MTKLIDWTEIVRDLLEHYNQIELSRMTGVHQGVISDLYNGKPKPYLSWTYGDALLKAHQALKSDKTESVS